MVNKMHDEKISLFVEKHNRNEMRGGYMYVCVYMYVYIYTYVYMYMYVCVYIYICICVYVCVRAHIYILKVNISFVARNLAQNGWKHKR